MLVVFYIFEQDRSNQIHFGEEGDDHKEAHENEFDVWKTIILIANCIITFYNIYIFTK